MYVTELKASPNDRGNQIDLSWKNPSLNEFPNFRGVKIVRRIRRYPETSPPKFNTDSELSFDISLELQNDLDNKYVSLELLQAFENHGRPLAGQVEILIQESGVKWLINDQTHVYSIQKQTDRLEVNHSGYFEYDGEIISYSSQESLSDKGLKGELIYYYTFYTFFIHENNPGSYRFEHQTNRNSSISAMATSNYGMSEQLYDLLPNIYKQYDSKGELKHFLEIFGSQFDLIRSFIAGTRSFFDIDQCDGALIPLLAQWIGWQTDHSLDIDTQRNAVRNAPFLYRTVGTASNLRAIINRVTNWDCQIKEFHHNVFRSNAAPELAIWMQQKTTEGWETATPFILDTAYEGAPAVLRAKDGAIWLFYYAIGNESSDIWCKTFKNNEWQPAQRLTDGKGLHKYPTVTQVDDTIHLFWSALEENIWNLKTATYDGANWSEPVTIEELKSNFSDIEPATITDNNNAMWLFWSSRRTDSNCNFENSWHIWYSYKGSINENWSDPQNLNCGVASDRKPKAIIFNDKIWVFWNRKTTKGWRIYYKFLENKKESDWNNVAENPFPESLENVYYDDKEPNISIDANGNLALYWSSNRIWPSENEDQPQLGAYNIWKRTCDRETGDWQPTGEIEQVTDDADLSAGPAVLRMSDDRIWLWYRSAQSIEYMSQKYRDTKTLDHRFAGSTTADTNNAARINRRDQFEDNQSYVYGKNKTCRSIYARDIIGIYLMPDTEDQALINRGWERIQGILHRFLPIQLKAIVFIIPKPYDEYIFTDDLPREVFYDRTMPEVYKNLFDQYKDKALGLIWMRAWSEVFTDHCTVDFEGSPIITKYRTWHVGLEN